MPMLNIPACIGCLYPATIKLTATFAGRSWSDNFRLFRMSVRFKRNVNHCYFDDGSKFASYLIIWHFSSASNPFEARQQVCFPRVDSRELSLSPAYLWINIFRRPGLKQSFLRPGGVQFLSRSWTIRFIHVTDWFDRLSRTNWSGSGFLEVFRCSAWQRSHILYACRWAEFTVLIAKSPTFDVDAVCAPASTRISFFYRQLIGYKLQVMSISLHRIMSRYQFSMRIFRACDRGVGRGDWLVSKPRFLNNINYRQSDQHNQESWWMSPRDTDVAF